ncbi:DUF1176 domain-containing protein [Phreatobacter cathodiphilus]|uniref:DUF1176 domain-containing protein n=1 Tax=Phreatobacter cathodiphilus TaxID=1868589 RepID=A0A2S0NB98_9HYPH|nr:DUF1176 domain-containing protein [Phreatobacter cathodiphilus]AVO45366.1 hypothetical protein C6569_10005 [Phreatobacter cathodiphilus]
MHLRTLLAAGLCLAVGTALAEERGHVRTFRDWVVGCDNARTCRAFGMAARDSSTQLAVRIDRSGDPGAVPTVTVILAQDATLPAGTRLKVTADGGAMVEVVIGRGATVEDGEVTLTDRAAAGRLIDEIRRGRSLAVSLDPAQGSGERADPISLDGAMAALLWMDDRQKRVGTVTALARPGESPAAIVPRPPQAPARRDGVAMTGPPVPSPLPEAWTGPVMQAFRAIPGDACNQEDDNDEDIEAQRLSERLVLISVRCWRGAYNFSRAYYILEDGPSPRVRPASFPRIREALPAAEDPPSNRNPDHILWNGELDPAGGTVFHLAKGRGMSDCGEIGEWRWDGARFQPLRLEVMPTCRGLLPPNWLTLYRTR